MCNNCSQVRKAYNQNCYGNQCSQTRGCNSCGAKRGCGPCNTASDCLSGNCSNNCENGDCFESTGPVNEKYPDGASKEQWEKFAQNAKVEDVDMGCCGSSSSLIHDGVNNDAVQVSNGVMTGNTLSSDSGERNKLSDYGDVMRITDSDGSVHFYMPPSQKEMHDLAQANGGSASKRWTELTGDELKKYLDLKGENGDIVSPDIKDNNKADIVSPDINNGGTNTENNQIVAPQDTSDSKNSEEKDTDSSAKKSEETDAENTETPEENTEKAEETAKEQYINNVVTSIQKHFNDAGGKVPTKNIIESAVKSEISRWGVNLNNNQTLNPFIVQRIINNLTTES